MRAHLVRSSTLFAVVPVVAALASCTGRVAVGDEDPSGLQGADAGGAGDDGGGDTGTAVDSGGPVTLESIDCRIAPEFAANAGSPDAVIVPFVDQLSTSTTAASIEAAARLAFVQIDRYGPGLPAASPSMPRRPLVLLSCDTSADEARVMTHLVALQRPAVIGSSLSAAVLRHAPTTIPAGMFYLSTAANPTPTLTALADRGLVWGARPSESDAWSLSNVRLSADESAVRTSLGLSTSSRIRVAVVSSNSLASTARANAVTSALSFNGVTGSPSTSASADFLAVKLASPATSADIASAASTITAFAPHVILDLTDEDAGGLVSAVEQAWSVSAYRPRYEISEATFGPTLGAAVAAAPATRTRLLGMRQVAGRGYADFAVNYRAAYGSDPDALASFGYDAAYVTGYAYFATGKTTPSGSDVAAAMGRLTPVGPTPQFVVGPGADSGNVNRTFVALASGNADLDGSSGTLDFDLTTGYPRGQARDVVCYGSSGQLVPTGMTCDPKTGTCSGTVSCP